jgi:FkbH-like protein
VRAEAGEYGQWFALSAADSAPDSGPFDFVVIWTLPEQISPAFSRLLQFESSSRDELLRDVDEFCQVVVRLTERTPMIFVPLWAVPAYNRGWGALDLVKDGGIRRALLEMNARLCQNLTEVKGVFPLDPARWIERSGRGAFHPKLWYMAKSPFGNEVYAEAVNDIKAALNSSIGRTRKLIVVDLDEMLWGGVVGEVGWRGIQLGGHDHVGEAHQDFQRGLLALKNRGVLLAIASKNEEPLAMEAIREHPEMVLKPEDFVAWRINWKDKAENVVDLARELNLGLDSVVFLDDSEHERQRVRNALPEVLVPDWPADKTQYRSQLMSLKCFDSLQVSSEDGARTRMYHDEENRVTTKRSFASVEDWLGSLGLTVEVSSLQEADMPRVVQLLNKTNQMNLTTRRLNEQELRQWWKSSGAAIWTIRASDRYGDSGLVGVVSVVLEEGSPDAAGIIGFILSGRVFGRNIEDAMLHLAIIWAREQRREHLMATYIPTEKNRVCLDFWMKSGCERCSNGCTFVWPTKKLHTLPSHLKLEWQSREVLAKDD